MLGNQSFTKLYGVGGANDMDSADKNSRSIGRSASK